MAQTSATIDPRTLLGGFRVAALPGYGMLSNMAAYAAVYATGPPSRPARFTRSTCRSVAPGGGAPPVAPAPAPVAPAPAPAAAATPAQTDAARAARLLRFGATAPTRSSSERPADGARRGGGVAPSASPRLLSTRINRLCSRSAK